MGGVVGVLDLTSGAVKEIYRGSIPPLDLFWVSMGDVKYLLYVGLGDHI
jgi:hypothetical protein